MIISIINHYNRLVAWAGGARQPPPGSAFARADAQREARGAALALRRGARRARGSEAGEAPVGSWVYSLQGDDDDDDDDGYKVSNGL